MEECFYLFTTLPFTGKCAICTWQLVAMWRVKVSSFSWGVMNEMKKLMTDTFRSRWYCSPCPTLQTTAKDPSLAAPQRKVYRRRYSGCSGRLFSVYVTLLSFQITKKIPSNPTMFNKIWQLIRRFQTVQGTGKCNEVETMMRRCLRKVWRTKMFLPNAGSLSTPFIGFA